MTELSKAAQRLYKRVRLRHNYYKAYGAKAVSSAAAMQELVDAGLVTTAGRVLVVGSCFVPVGYKPHEPEVFPPVEE